MADGQKRDSSGLSKGQQLITNLRQNIINPGTPGIGKASIVKAMYAAKYSWLLWYSSLHEEQENISLQPLHSC